MAFQFEQTGQEIQDILNQVGDIGTTAAATNQSDVTVASGTYSGVVSVTLPAGKWIVMGKTRLTGHSAGQFTLAAGLSDTAGVVRTTSPYYPFQSQTTNGTNPIMVSASAILTLSAATTIYMVLFQSSGGAVTCPSGTSSILAIRIA